MTYISYVSEHWYQNLDLECIVLPNYQLISHVSRTERLHGGTAIYAKKSLDETEIGIVKRMSKEMHINFCGISYTYSGNHLAVFRRPYIHYEKHNSMESNILVDILELFRLQIRTNDPIRIFVDETEFSRVLERCVYNTVPKSGSSIEISSSSGETVDTEMETIEERTLQIVPVKMNL
nr:unnamed protein product [Callosobruchus analis]